MLPSAKTPSWERAVLLQRTCPPTRSWLEILQNFCGLLRRRKSKTMANPMKVPFLDLVTPHKELEEELLAVVKKAFSNAGFIGGPVGGEFEGAFAPFSERTDCVGV